MRGRHAGTLLARAEPMLRQLHAEREAQSRRLKSLASSTAKCHDAATTTVRLRARLEAMCEVIRILVYSERIRQHLAFDGFHFP